MTRLERLYSVDSFRESVESLLALNDDDFEAVRAAALAEVTTTSSNAPIETEEGLRTRALALMIDTSLRSSPEEVVEELRAAFPDAPVSAMDRLVSVITPDDVQRAQVRGIQLRDAFLPVLTGHRFALDLRVVAGPDGSPVGVPLISARFWFDSPVSVSNDAIVYQLNVEDIDRLITELAEVREFAENLQESSSALKVAERSDDTGA